MKNAKKAVVEFEERLSTEIKRQEKLKRIEKSNFKREELSEKYMAKMLYRWNDKKFEEKYSKKLERN